MQVAILILIVLLINIVAATINNQLYLDNLLQIVYAQEVQLRTFVLQVYFTRVVSAVIPQLTASRAYTRKLVSTNLSVIINQAVVIIVRSLEQLPIIVVLEVQVVLQSQASNQNQLPVKVQFAETLLISIRFFQLFKSSLVVLCPLLNLFAVLLVLSLEQVVNRDKGLFAVLLKLKFCNRVLYLSACILIGTELLYNLVFCNYRIMLVNVVEFLSVQCVAKSILLYNNFYAL